MREFLHVDDLGRAVLFTLENKLDNHLYNVGTGVDLTIKELAKLIQETVGHKGEIEWIIQNLMEHQESSWTILKSRIKAGTHKLPYQQEYLMSILGLLEIISTSENAND